MPLWLLGVGNWMKQIPGWVWFALVAVAAALLGIYVVDRNAVQRTRHKDEIKDLKDEMVLRDKAEEIVNDIETRVEGADIAVSRFPFLRSSRELRDLNPELAAIILTDTDERDE